MRACSARLDVDPFYDQIDRLDALIATAPAHTLEGIHLKARVSRTIARGDEEAAWTMLHALMRDLIRAALRAVVAELAEEDARSRP